MADCGEVKLDNPARCMCPRTSAFRSAAAGRSRSSTFRRNRPGCRECPTTCRPSNPLNPYADYTVAQMFDFLGRYQLPRDVGAAFEYSNLGVGLLGHALARRAGKSYEALVRERILNPTAHGPYRHHADGVDGRAPRQGAHCGRRGGVQLGYPHVRRRWRTALDDDRHVEVRAGQSRAWWRTSAAGDATDAYGSPLHRTRTTDRSA